MIPFASFTYFGVLLYVVIPSVAVGLFGRARRLILPVATAVMLVVQYGVTTTVWPGGPAVTTLWLVLAFALAQWAVAWAFLAIRRRRAGRGTAERLIFFGAVGLALAPIIVVRLSGVTVGLSLAGFTGLSYVMFRALDVVICIQDRIIRDLSFGRYLLFLLFFPTISAGPIDRYRRFVGDLERSRDRAAFLADLDTTVHLVMTGFALKFILAEVVRRFALEPAATVPGLSGLVLYAYAYAFYLYFDFAGYSAFAIGVACLFGIHVPTNFRRPFLAGDIREFWNRWHISLSTWFRDHVYMRFLMAATRGKWFRDRNLASYAGLVVSFGLMGAWHGIEPHYLFYGLYHAGLLIGHDLFSRWNAKRQAWGEGPGWRAAGVLVTFHAVCLGLLLFSGRLG